MNLKHKTHNGIYISAKIENKSKNPAKQHLKKKFSGYKPDSYIQEVYEEPYKSLMKEIQEVS